MIEEGVALMFQALKEEVIEEVRALERL